MKASLLIVGSTCIYMVINYVCYSYELDQCLDFR